MQYKYTRQANKVIRFVFLFYSSLLLHFIPRPVIYGIVPNKIQGRNVIQRMDAALRVPVTFNVIEHRLLLVFMGCSMFNQVDSNSGVLNPWPAGLVARRTL